MEIAQALEAQIVEVKKQKTLLHEKWTKMLADVKKKTLAHEKANKEYLESVKQAETVRAWQRLRSHKARGCKAGIR
jgi:hypothetical protein